MNARFEVHDAGEELVIMCPRCDAVWAQGRYATILTHEEEKYVIAELQNCCGQIPQPVVLLYNERAAAKKDGAAVIYNLGIGVQMGLMPVLTLDAAQESYGGVFGSSFCSQNS